MSSMEEEMASAKAHRSVFNLFRVPELRWRACSLFLVKYAIPSPLPGTGPKGRRAPASLVGHIPGWDRQLLPQEPGRRGQAGCAELVRRLAVQGVSGRAGLGSQSRGTVRAWRGPLAIRGLLGSLAAVLLACQPCAGHPLTPQSNSGWGVHSHPRFTVRESRGQRGKKLAQAGRARV